MVQEQYWRELYQIKVHVNYLEILLEQADLVDRGMKIILAVSASASIGAWVIWQSLSMVWASIIAVSQVLTAIRPYLPYAERLKAYSALILEIEEILLRAESKWHSIAEGELTEAEINEARFEVRTSKARALRKHLPNAVVPSKESVRIKAEEQANTYFRLSYPN